MLAIAVLCVLGIAIVALLFKLFLPISTPAFRDAQGQVLPGSVAVVERWQINGLDESVIIRGRDVRNPILIRLHGGPGSADAPIARHFNAALEDHFVVVYWDQRYAGQSLDPFGPVPKTLRIDDYVSDLDVLVNRLLTRFGKKKVVLLGHSWGTILGTLYAERHPEKVFAYVGVGQCVNTSTNETLSYNYVLAQATSHHDAAALADLKRIGPPPYRGDDIGIERMWLEKFGGSWHADIDLNKLILIGAMKPETNWRNIVAVYRSGVYSRPVRDGDFLTLALDHGHTRFAVPMFFVAGRYDQQSVASLAHAYYEDVSAPRKDFVWFEKSAHSPPYEEPDIFNAWVIKTIRPLAN